MRFNLLEQYLNNILYKEDLKDRKANLFTREHRTGIEIDETTGRAKEGMLYRKELLRSQKDGDLFCLEVKETNGLLPEEGMLKFGGESKAVSYRRAEELRLKPVIYSLTRELMKESGCFKMYLLTPAIFERGWLPDWECRDEDKLIFQLPTSKLKIRILTAALGKYEMVSGWDIAENSPKPGYRVVPPGSVYYCEVIDDDFAVKDLMADLHGKSISDKRTKEGFGISYLGGIVNV
jgi:CRISPR-associated protein Cmr3